MVALYELVQGSVTTPSRHAARAEAASALERAIEYLSPQMVHIQGDMGVGKSRLCQAAMMMSGTIIGEIKIAMIPRRHGISERLSPIAASVPSAVDSSVAQMPIQNEFLIERTHCALLHMSAHQPFTASGAGRLTT